jgi:cardiolipin synthase A/B
MSRRSLDGEGWRQGRPGPSHRPEALARTLPGSQCEGVSETIRPASVEDDLHPAAPSAPSGRAAGAGPSFARALWRIGAADVSPGNRVTLFADGDTTFDAMIALIAAAKDSVALESYILRDDDVGQRFAAALTAAAASGVRVRVLGDWIGMRGTSARFVRGLRARGVDVRVFSPPGFRPWLGLVPRDHRKVLVVDGSAGVTGGIGIGEQWQRGVIRKRHSPWRDRCVRIEGPAAADLERAFEHMWRRAAGQRPSREERRMRRQPRNAHLDPASAVPSLVGIVEGEPGRMRVGRALHLQAAGAQRSIWLASAYFVPSFAEVDALNGAAGDGVDVRLLVPGRNDHPWVHPLTRRYYRRLLRHGVRIWEWQGEMMHAKTSIVDGRWTRVGSTDFNPLGVAINYELDAYVEDATVAATAEGMFLRELEQSREVRGVPPR